MTLRAKYLALCASLLVLSACQPRRAELPTFSHETQAATILAASLHARDIGGSVSLVLPTGSMCPTLEGGDFIVVSSPANEPFEKIAQGDVVRYVAPGSPHFNGDVGPIVHRAVQKDAGGWIMSGDANAHSESRWRLTRENYLGRVVAVYRTRPL